ncbi:MAG TPA: mechanosensitive ion channel family protein [Gemmatimonadales bacterium]|nr:mechanosensitive ion channel family protein [Gemmatimonadales bacterium]
MDQIEQLIARLQHPRDLLGHAIVVLLIAAIAFLLQLLARRLVAKVVRTYRLQAEFAIVTRRVTGFIIYATALLLILERLGVSGSVLWTAFTGFAAVAAVAFFAAWSVLSNLFCTMLILTTRPFRRRDRIEVLESADKPGFGGRVRDIRLVYTVIEELDRDGNPAGTILRIPNNMFFQRTLRRWPTREDLAGFDDD